MEGERRNGDDYREGDFRGDSCGKSNWRYKKLDLPPFEGINPVGWIMRAERYYHFYRLSEEVKVEAVVVGLEGDTLLWYQWEQQTRKPINTWEEMKGMLLRQFRPLDAGSLHEQWLTLVQEGTMEDYRSNLSCLSHC